MDVESKGFITDFAIVVYIISDVQSGCSSGGVVSVCNSAALRGQIELRDCGFGFWREIRKLLVSVLFQSRITIGLGPTRG